MHRIMKKIVVTVVPKKTILKNFPVSNIKKKYIRNWEVK